MIEIIRADARRIPLADESIDCVVTSPPYWGLRDYGVEGQLGLERLHDCLGWARGSECEGCHVCAMRRVFREVHRVLKPTGTLWLNYGDCYATGNVGDHPGGGDQGEAWSGRAKRSKIWGKHADHGIGPMTQPNRMPLPGLKPKDLVGMAWRIAFALQADGWWLRNDIIWSKPNPMPESCTDRATKSHEYLFLLAKSQQYHFDYEEWREEASVGNHHRNVTDSGKDGPAVPPGRSKHLGLWKTKSREAGRNRRTVWTHTTSQTSEAHFATMPAALVEPCILAGCPAGGTVFDPFCGSGTTLAVANRLGRSGIGLELNPEYIEIARRRIFSDVTPTRAEKASGQKLLPIGGGA